MQTFRPRQIIIGFILVVTVCALILFIGTTGTGKKIGAPGLDMLVSGMLERFNVSGRTGSMPETTLPSNISEVVGTWSGMSEIDGLVWEFVFEENFAVRVSNTSGYFYDGTAFVHWNKGLVDGHVRVPPGWNVLDVDTIHSSEPSHRNAISLGAYSLRKNLLKYCFSIPGKLIRPVNDLSREGIQCFELTKAAAGAPKATKTPQHSSIPQAASLPAFSTSDQQAALSALSLPAIAGYAEIIINGSREIWPLRTDQSAETDLTNPHRVMLQFQAHGTKFPAARRIELAIDTTRAGAHSADGLVYRENLFIRERITVGKAKYGVSSAIFLYIAEGGRIYPPRTACDIVITSSYGGGEDMLLEGNITGCVVSSGSEQFAVESISFVVRGKRQL